VFEHRPIKTTGFELFGARSTFTDDTVLVTAVAQALLDDLDYVQVFHRWYERYPDAGYGAAFAAWADSASDESYGSWGNGAAMRVAPVAWVFDDLETVLDEAARCAAVTHDHAEGMKGAQAAAAAVFLARQGRPADYIRRAVADLAGYDLSQTVAALRPDYSFDVSCQGSVPPALRCFLEADDFESAVRNAVSLGGDADTMAAIAGAAAEAAWGVPGDIEAEVRRRLPADILDVLDRFRARFVPAAGH
jgi:ADP-ribosylglycohydrolase